MPSIDDEEIWFNLPRFPGFSVSTHGNVMDPDENVLERYSDASGAMCVTIRIPGWDWEFDGPVVWQMLRYMFVGNIADVEVFYWDENPGNTHIDNLKICFLNPDGDWVPIAVTVLSSGMRSLDRRHKNRVMIIETGEIFDNVSECARHIGGSSTNIFAYFRGVTKSVKGYTFKRV